MLTNIPHPAATSSDVCHLPLRMRFFEEYDNRPVNQPMSAFCREHGAEEWCPSQPTASRWLQQRQLSQRAPIRPAKKKGMRRKEISNVVDLIVRKQKDGNMEKDDWKGFTDMANCSQATLRRRINADSIVQPKIRNMIDISEADKTSRKAYGERYRYETVESLWQWVHWTGEACVERALAVDHFIVTNRTRPLLASLVTQLEDSKEGLLMEVDTHGHAQVLWLAASVSWNHKSRLMFWNDRAYEDLLNEWQASRPTRGLKRLTEESFQSQLREWHYRRLAATNTPFKRQMYSQQILPQHISYLQAQKAAGLPAILAYDDSESAIYGIETPSPPQAREKARLQLHALPSQSRDVDPMYACFYLLNERLRQNHGEQLKSMDYWQLRHAIESAWDSIELKELRDRISDLPRRCKKLSVGDGGRIKGYSW